MGLSVPRLSFLGGHGSRPGRIALCAIIAALLYLPGLGTPALLEPDEGRYAEIAREMVVSGDYLTPRDDWVRYFEKPPLVYWANAASIRIFGPNEFAVRLPTALCSVGEVAVTEVIGETMFGAAAGMLGAMALALSPLFFGFARFATLDPALAFFFTAALGAFYLAIETPDLRARRSRTLLILASIMLALGTLTKGPVAIVLGGAIGLAFMLIQRRTREILRMPWLAMIAVYGAIVVPWFAIVAARNPGFLSFFLLHEHVARYLESSEHGWGPYLLVVVAAAGTWPWLYFACSGAAELWRERATNPARNRDPLAFLILWFGIVLIFFSIPRSKLGSYILPGLPPIAILAGFGLARFVKRGAGPAFLGWFAAINLAIGCAIGAALGVFANRLGRGLIIDGAMIAVAFIVIALAAIVPARRGRPAIALAIIAIAVLFASGAGLKLRRDAAAFYSYRRLARVVAPQLGPGCVLASYRHFVQSLPFYTGHREAIVGYRGELAPFSDDRDAQASFIPDLAGLARLWKSPACVVAIVNFHDLPRVTPALGSISVLGCEGKKVALSNRAAPQRPLQFDCRGTLPASGSVASGALGLRPGGD
ncbi:MAG TPA: phospholipid carrier-dependent glycosyltransferase [Candidatus Binataceae bacterium]|nr:phospholipid carrier-dependent glycosyltransferase [Candidatus Binataceae bacterium]